MFRIAAKRAVIASGSVGAGLLAFPHVEDWYWHKKDPERVCHIQDGDNHEHTQGAKDDGKKRPKLVILGTGWGSAATINSIDRDQYDITVISPRNSFLFTPLLPCTAVGTLSPTSVAVPIRQLTTYKACSYWQRLRYMWRGYLPPRIQYLYAYANDIDPATKTLKCHFTGWGKDKDFSVNYDQLVLAVGSKTNTWGLPGVDEYCHYLKEPGDAMLLRQQLINNLETAALPGTSDEERRQLLTFYIIGGGPTGVEFSAELYDFLADDVANSKHATYKHVAGHAQITLVQSNDKLLPGYPSDIQDFSYNHLTKNMKVNVATNTRVTGVTADTLTLMDKKTKQSKSVPYGIVLWSTGTAPMNISKTLMKKLPKTQTSRRSILVDSHCRVLGAPDILAIGDCSDIDLKDEYLAHVQKIFQKHANKPCTGTDDKGRLVRDANQAFIADLEHSAQGGFLNDCKHDGLEIAQRIVNDFKERFEKQPKSEMKNSPFQGVSEKDVEQIVQRHVSKQKHLPPTAQVAQQQGDYIGRLLSGTVPNNVPFNFTNRGQLVYVGSHMAGCAIPGTNNVDVTWNGTLTNLFWHAAYFGMLESSSARYELLVDWFKTHFFGRSTAVPLICTDNSLKHYAALRRTGMKEQGGGPTDKKEGTKAAASSTSSWFARK